MITSDYNIAYSRRRYLRPLLKEEEIRELVELEKVCFPPPENYDLRTMKMFLSLNGAGLLRWREEDEVAKRASLIAFHLFDCLGGELITLDVHPDHRRKGIGSALLTESMGKLKALGHMSVTCQIGTENAPSLQMHARFGFRKRRILKNYYGPGRDAYLLNARL